MAGKNFDLFPIMDIHQNLLFYQLHSEKPCVNVCHYIYPNNQTVVEFLVTFLVTRCAGNRPVVEFNGQESRSVNFMTVMSEKISPPLQFYQVCAY